jgi:hypothetical protein
MTDLNKLQNEIKRIGTGYDGLDFIYEFLSAYEIPKATIARLEMGRKKGQDTPFCVTKTLYCQFTSKTNLYSELDLLKKDGLDKIRTRFIFLTNSDYVLAYDKDTDEALSSSKEELFQHFDFFFPLIGREKVGLTLNETVDLKAAEKFAQLYNQLLVDNKNTEDSDLLVNNLLLRLLFCFFADSVEIIPKGTIHKLVLSYSSESGEDLGILIESIFLAMSAINPNGIPYYLTQLPVIDIALFKKHVNLPQFNKQTRQLILDISKLDWSAVNPDILGSLIQSIVFPESCNGLSNNFTSIPNINKVIGPLFLNGLYEAYEKAKGNHKDLLNLLNRISKIRIFDPACGTGNFLIVTYKELKLLESRIIESINSLAEGKEEIPHCLNLSQFYGIEMNELACEVAKLGLFFTECQLSRVDNGKSIDAKQLLHHLNLENIVHANATRISWDRICPKDGNETYIIGNPSYKGARKQSAEQKSDVCFVFSKYDKIKDLDYAACWFYLASGFIENSRNAFAFVTTNSLTQGEQVDLLWPKLFGKNVHISFAHSAFKWKNSGRNNTGVTVVIIGMRSNLYPSKKIIFTQTTSSEVPSINPYLTSVGDVIICRRKKPISNLPKMPKGNMPYDGGHLLLTPSEKTELVNAYPASERFLKRVMGSEEFINGIERWCIWISDEDLGEALSIPPIKERVSLVEKARRDSPDHAANKLAERPHQFRETNVTTTQSLIIPSVSSERREYIPIGFVKNDTIITNLAFAVYDCEPWIFGVIASRMHNVWARAVCGGLETRIRYSSALGYNTFPFPSISEEQKKSITKLVYDIIAEREKEPEKTMAQKYDPDTMNDGLRSAHRILDIAIERCYQEDPFVSDQERLEFLFNSYKELSA